MTIHFSTVAKMGAGGILTGMAIRYLRVSHPVTIVGLTVMGQAIAWMPDFVSRCLRTLRPPSPPNLCTMSPEILVRIQGSLDRKDIANASLPCVNRYLRDNANDPIGVAIDQFDDADSVTLEELRALRAVNSDFSRPEKEFELNLNSTITDAELQD